LRTLHRAIDRASKVKEGLLSAPHIDTEDRSLRVGLLRCLLGEPPVAGCVSRLILRHRLRACDSVGHFCTTRRRGVVVVFDRLRTEMEKQRLAAIGEVVVKPSKRRVLGLQRLYAPNHLGEILTTHRFAHFLQISHADRVVDTRIRKSVAIGLLFLDELFVLLAQPRQIGPQERDPLDRLFHAAVTARLQAQRCINGFQRRIEARPACFSLLVHLHLLEVGCLPSYRQSRKVQGLENGKGILAKATMRR
jgi:hypothetical protein